MLGAGDGNLLQHVAAGIHQCHHGAGERLPERQCGSHRQERNRIDAQSPGQQITDDRDREARYDGDGCERPAKTRGVGPVRRMRQNARPQSQERNCDKHPSQGALGDQ